MVDRETAEAEFNHFGEMMGLDFDESGMDEEDLKSFKGLKDRFIKAVEKGSLVVNENGEPVYTPERVKGNVEVKPITFYEPTGGTLQASDKRATNELITKQNLMLAEMTKTSAGIFAKMQYQDYRMCTTVLSLFLA